MWQRLVRPARKQRRCCGGHDPSVAKKLNKLSGAASSVDSLELVAREWHDLNKSQWSSRHAADVISSLEKDVFPLIGNLPIRTITPQSVLAKAANSNKLEVWTTWMGLIRS